MTPATLTPVSAKRRIDLVGSIPFVGVHIAALWAIWLPFG